VASTAKACCRALCSLFVWRTWGTFEADFHGYGWYRRRHVEALKHDRGIHREESTQSSVPKDRNENFNFQASEPFHFRGAGKP